MVGKVIKTRSKSNKLLKQDENVVPCLKDVNLTNTKRNHRQPLTIESDVQSAKKNNSSIKKSEMLTMKSPILRDRTNTTNALAKTDFALKQNNNMKSIGNKNSGKQRNMKKEAEGTDKKLLRNAQVLVQKYTVNKKLSIKTSTRKNKNVISGQEENFNKESTKENVDTFKLNEIEQNKVEELSNNNSESQNINLIKNKVFKKKNISIEVLDKLLNHDEETDIESDKEIPMKTRHSKTQKVKQNIDLNMDEQKLDILKTLENNRLRDNQQMVKKIFKNKVQKELKPVNGNVKNEQHRVLRNRNIKSKKAENHDYSYKLKIKEQRKSIKPLKKSLRTRTIKNYCEESKLAQSSNSFEEEKIPFKPSNIEGEYKGVPIYKQVQLPQENIKDKEEIYNFPDDSQEIKQVKKKKKTIRKPVTKKSKKIAVSKTTAFQKVQKRPAKKVVQHVQFNDQIEEPIDLKQTTVVNNVKNKLIVPNHLENAGDTTLEEASTIKIVSDQILEQSKQIDLTVTPLVPKTIVSELKLFGPKNAITSEPTTQYNKMVNHSLIRKSISPIKKLIENFDAGSPWRPIDPFSRVRNVVQSTPQLHKLTLTRENKLPVLSNLRKKPISFNDTIPNDKILNNKENLQVNKKTKLEISPRKIGTIISNLSNTECINEQINNEKNSLEMTCSPVQITSPAVNDTAESITDEVPKPTSYINDTNENKTSNLKVSPQKKFSTPCPFRFEKIRSSRRIASIESQSKSPVCSLNKEIEIEPLPGPSNIEKPEKVLRQSNLNNFLNLPEMPKSTQILTNHGIFDDAYSTPIDGKKPKPLLEEANIQNAFGFDDCEISEVSPIVKSTSTSRIATEKDVEQSVKGKIFPKARIKSSLLTKNLDRKIKTATLKNVLKKKLKNEAPENTEENINQKDSKIKKAEENNNELDTTNKALLDAVSFSDTFDVLSENGEDPQTKIPDNIPLFVDLEPVHFTQPPRRSYNKRKREVCFDNSRNYFELSDDECEKPKSKKKKESKVNKEELKRMQQWVKSVNESFNDIEDFDLIVE